jgi:hypothetical protein
MPAARAVEAEKPKAEPAPAAAPVRKVPRIERVRAAVAPAAAVPTAGVVPQVAPKLAKAPENELLKTPPRDSFLQALRGKYGTDDLLEIMALESGARNHENVLKLWDKLDAAQRGTDKAALLKIRALRSSGNTAGLRSFVSDRTIRDGEFCLVKAQLAYARGDIVEAEANLARGERLPAAYMQGGELRQDVAYYKALCASAEFDASPSEKTYKNALDLWYQLRRAVRTQPAHRYNKKAAAEIQRVGRAYRSTQGG